MKFSIQTPEVVAKSHDRIEKHIHRTPILYSNALNRIFESNIYFKIDAMQKTGAFKIRGVLNHLLTLKEQGRMPKKIVAYSTGNHGLAMSYISKIFNLQARIYLPQNVAPIKEKIAKHYGGEVISVKTREEAEIMAKKDGEGEYYYLHPSDSDETIAGSGTMCFEALQEFQIRNIPMPDAIFASCGGGGLLSGSYLAKELLAKQSKLIGVEPANANDAFNSIESNRIYRFKDSPDTIADALRALSISERTFNYLKQLDEFYLVEEKEIYYWTAWLIQLLKITCEPSSAINMAAAHQWLRKNGKGKNILILISGGNIDSAFHRKLWQENHLDNAPK